MVDTVDMAEKKFITINDVKTHIKTAGKGQAIVFLHGMGLSDLWLDFHQELAKDFLLYAPDHPGFGLSDNPEYFDSMEDFILHYVDLFTALNLNSVTLVGHSLGGWIGAEIASFFPQLIKKLVLISPSGLRIANSPIADIFALSAEQLAMLCFNDISKVMVVAAQRDRSDMKKLFLQDYRERTMVAKLAWTLGYSPKLERRLRRISSPTLIIWGKEDQLISTAYAQAYKNAINGSSLAIIDDCGHVPIVEQTEQTINLIKEFIMKEQG
ncbi:MAG: alpha/beta hydrolase [Acidobacteria bacterium]|nr:alpha/beta hydrolase [Acidobacteriota bacterium]